MVGKNLKVLTRGGSPRLSWESGVAAQFNFGIIFNDLIMDFYGCQTMDFRDFSDLRNFGNFKDLRDFGDFGISGISGIWGIWGISGICRISGMTI